MDQNPKEWWIGHHYGFGMGVRNLLREGGFEWERQAASGKEIKGVCEGLMQRVFYWDLRVFF